MTRVWHQVLEYNPKSVHRACQRPQLHAPIIVPCTLSEDSPYSHVDIEDDEQRHSDKRGRGQVLAGFPLGLLRLGDGIRTVDTHYSMTSGCGSRIGTSVKFGENHWKGNNQTSNVGRQTQDKYRARTNHSNDLYLEVNARIERILLRA